MRKTCTVEGCNKYRIQGGLCTGHGAVRQRCTVERCYKRQVQGGLCIRHGAVVKRCTVEGCNKYRVQGGLCMGHGAVRKRCTVEGCEKRRQQDGMCLRHARVKREGAEEKEEIARRTHMPKRGAATDINGRGRKKAKRHTRIKERKEEEKKTIEEKKDEAQEAKLNGHEQEQQQLDRGLLSLEAGEEGGEKGLNARSQEEEGGVKEEEELNLAHAELELGASVAVTASPNKALSQEELLRKVIGYVGEGHSVFITLVSKGWKESYRGLYATNTTLIRSVVESVECLKWAWAAGKDQKDHTCQLSKKTLIKAAAEYGDVPVCAELRDMGCALDRSVCVAAVNNDRRGLSILKWLRGKNSCFETVMHIEAARQGKLEMLDWLLKDAFFNHKLLKGSIESGRLPVIEKVFGHSKVKEKIMESEGASEWRKGAFFAAKQGNLQVLQWLQSNARELCRWDAHVYSAAQSLSVLMWLNSEGVKCPLGKEACPQARKDTHLRTKDPAAFEEMKQWVHANGHPCDCED